MTLKEQILSLRAQGRAYNYIQTRLGCSKGTIAYHCSNTARANYHSRQHKLREEFILKLKEKAGGKCAICGYSKCIAALDFHHRDAETKYQHNGKPIGIGEMLSRCSKNKVIAEAKKCDLICANCHRELHFNE